MEAETESVPANEKDSSRMIQVSVPDAGSNTVDRDPCAATRVWWRRAGCDTRRRPRKAAHKPHRIETGIECSNRSYLSSGNGPPLRMGSFDWVIPSEASKRTSLMHEWVPCL